MANLGMYLNAIPAGQYHVQIIGSEIRDIQSGEGKYLRLDLKIMDGAYENKRLFDAVILKHKNSEIFDMSMRKLSEICQAAGLICAEDSEQLHNHSMIADIEVQQDAEHFGLTNKVLHYSQYNAFTAE